MDGFRQAGLIGLMRSLFLGLVGLLLVAAVNPAALNQVAMAEVNPDSRIGRRVLLDLRTTGQAVGVAAGVVD